jgi:hypothetical protein
MSNKKSLTFRKSTLSTHGGNTRCVEVAFAEQGVYVRNSKSIEPVVKFTFDEWSAFIGGVKNSEFDLPKV